MRIGIPKERRSGERRVAAVPQSVETMVGWEWEVVVETGAGVEAGFPDEAYTGAGASIVPDTTAAHGADVVLRVGPPLPDEVPLLRDGAVLVSFLDPFVDADLVRDLANGGVTSIAMEAIPRTTLAQSMDALSSQANVAGYAAVLLAAEESPKLLPMMVTAAGTIPPSKALILGVGVAGLQAIATARRLGAVVHAYDIRPETREQVESLGAKFVAAPTQEGDDSGYAKEVGEDTQAEQHAALAPFVAESDLLVTTAQIPGRTAPLLVTSEMVASMKPGSVIVDMAAETGGNVEPSVADEVVDVGGVHVYGPTNLASAVPTDASRMYARNLITLLQRARDGAGLTIDTDDEIFGECTITHRGEVVHTRSRQLLKLEGGGT
jgi:H+-translocating NAD(P) transhydrogenase subunit alpha